MPLPLPGASKRERVWDPFVRLFHWSLVAAFATAWYGRGEAAIHETAGEIVLVLIIARLAWGVIGPGSARFETFVRGPLATLRYAASIFGGRPKHHLGHNPAGAAMIVALLATLAVTAASGVLMTTTALWGNAAVEYVHGASAYLMLFLIAGHLAGVLLAAIQHRENLPLAMITGRKLVPAFVKPYLGGVRMGARRLAAAAAIAAAAAALWMGSNAALNASIWRLHKTVASEAKTSGCEVTKLDGPVVTVFPMAGVSYIVHARTEDKPLPVFVDMATALKRKPALDLAELKSRCGGIAARLVQLNANSTSAVELAMRSMPTRAAAVLRPSQPSQLSVTTAAQPAPVAAASVAAGRPLADNSPQTSRPATPQAAAEADVAPAAGQAETVAPPKRQAASGFAPLQARPAPKTFKKPGLTKPSAAKQRKAVSQKKQKRKRKGRRGRGSGQGQSSDNTQNHDDNNASGSGNSGSGSGNSGSGSGNSGSGSGN